MSPSNRIDESGPTVAGASPGAGGPVVGGEAVPCHDAVVLTGGGPVAMIHLNGRHYALRITRQGKLILTK